MHGLSLPDIEECYTSGLPDSFPCNWQTCPEIGFFEDDG